MIKSMPLCECTWVESISESYLLKYREDDNYAYFVEVDLEYPASMHILHQDIPLAPEKLCIQTDWMSSNGSQLNLNRSRSEKVPKLVVTLFDKNHHVCHINNLKFYVQHGLIIKKIYRALRFKQSEWLRSYIEKHTVLKKQAKTTFEKNFYKLMSNACFGKTMENKSNRRQFYYVTTE